MGTRLVWEPASTRPCASPPKLLAVKTQEAGQCHGKLQLLSRLCSCECLQDYLLNSALGRQDGDVYTALLSMAKVQVLNSACCVLETGGQASNAVPSFCHAGCASE